MRLVSRLFGITSDAETLETFRYERKFIAAPLNAEEVVTIVKKHPAIFFEAFQPRIVNNIYLDSVSFRSIVDIERGENSRRKHRIRWYGEDDSHALDPSLEIKVKEGFLGRKDAYRLTDIDFEEGISSDEIHNVIAASDIPPGRASALRQFTPVVANKYRRRYFRSADGRFRITVDDDIRYAGVNPRDPPFARQIHDRAVVLELKYAYKDDFEAPTITQFLPFRLVRNSKYVNALNQVYA